jgi:hypothetical protein
MDIKNHIYLILKKYNLYSSYLKFILFSVLNSTIREGFYWLLIYFSELIKEKPEYINLCSIILIILLIISIPVERYFNHIKATFIQKLKIANSHYFYDRISKLNKSELFMFNLV